MKQDKDKDSNQDKKPYEAPAIIYNGVITTRAGSPTGGDGDGADGIDPADLFGD